jgi:hypothetical protein
MDRKQVCADRIVKYLWVTLLLASEKAQSVSQSPGDVQILLREKKQLRERGK